MSRRIGLGLGSSLVLHAGVAALALALVRPEEPLPALVIDLREPFAAGSASARPPQRDHRLTPPARGRAPLATSEPRSAPVVEAPPAPALPPPAPAVDARPTLSPLPEPVVQAPAATPPPMSEPARDPAPLPLRPPDAFAATPSGPPRSNAGSSVAGRSGASATSEGGASSKSGNANSVSASAPGPAPTGSDDGTAGLGQGGGPTGPAVAAVPPGGSGAGAAGAEYGPYLTALRQRIQQSLRYPASARRRGVAGTVSVEILILPTGTIGGVTLLESSSHPVLDEAALDTIRSLPRMPLPPDLPARALRVRIPVVFQMR